MGTEFYPIPVMKDKTFVHKKSGRRLKVLNQPAGYWDHVDVLYLDQKQIRHGRKGMNYFHYDYREERASDVMEPDPVPASSLGASLGNGGLEDGGEG
jgi:hypothetical protein